MTERLRFEWDEQKEQINIKKHGIWFEDAIHVFKDPRRIERIDMAHSMDETRYQVIGRAEDTILFVVYTCRGGKIRIISARTADREERGWYL